MGGVDGGGADLGGVDGGGFGVTSDELRCSGEPLGLLGDLGGGEGVIGFLEEGVAGLLVPLELAEVLEDVEAPLLEGVTDADESPNDTDEVPDDTDEAPDGVDIL